MAKSIEIVVGARQYEDEDDCLTAAAREYAADHDLETWEVEARWTDDQREAITLTVEVQS